MVIPSTTESTSRILDISRPAALWHPPPPPPPPTHPHTMMLGHRTINRRRTRKDDRASILFGRRDRLTARFPHGVSPVPPGSPQRPIPFRWPTRSQRMARLKRALAAARSAVCLIGYNPCLAVVVRAMRPTADLASFAPWQCGSAPKIISPSLMLCGSCCGHEIRSSDFGDEMPYRPRTSG